MTQSADELGDWVIHEVGLPQYVEAFKQMFAPNTLENIGRISTLAVEKAVTLMMGDNINYAHLALFCGAHAKLQEKLKSPNDNTNLTSLVDNIYPEIMKRFADDMADDDVNDKAALLDDDLLPRNEFCLFKQAHMVHSLSSMYDRCYDRCYAKGNGYDKDIYESKTGNDDSNDVEEKDMSLIEQHISKMANDLGFLQIIMDYVGTFYFDFDQQRVIRSKLNGLNVDLSSNGTYTEPALQTRLEKEAAAAAAQAALEAASQAPLEAPLKGSNTENPISNGDNDELKLVLEPLKAIETENTMTNGNNDIASQLASTKSENIEDSNTNDYDGTTILDRNSFVRCVDVMLAVRAGFIALSYGARKDLEKEAAMEQVKPQLDQMVIFFDVLADLLGDCIRKFCNPIHVERIDCGDASVARQDTNVRALVPGGSPYHIHSLIIEFDTPYVVGLQTSLQNKFSENGYGGGYIRISDMSIDHNYTAIAHFIINLTIRRELISLLYESLREAIDVFHENDTIPTEEEQMLRFALHSRSIWIKNFRYKETTVGRHGKMRVITQDDFDSILGNNFGGSSLLASSAVIGWSAREWLIFPVKSNEEIDNETLASRNSSQADAAVNRKLARFRRNGKGN